MEQKKRVGIWVRVSTEFQVENDSPEVHEQRARYYAQAKGWEVVEVYRLEAVSGKTVIDLPQTKKMLRDIETGHISALIFSKLARLARKTKELLELSELVRAADADMISLAESIDTSSPAGRLFYTIVAAMTQWEREEIADRVSASVPIRAKMGKPLGGAAPYGYRWVNKELVIDEHEAPIRKLIYDLFIQYRKKGVVATKLNQLGHRTRGGSKFSDTTIGRLLHDSTAKGLRLANYTKSLGDGKNWVLKPESEWIQIACPAVVSADLWDECDKILTQQETKNKRASKPVAHLFSGLLYCECGGKMYVYSEGTKYKCSKCRKTKIETSDMEEIYYQKLKDFLLTDNDLGNFFSKADATITEKETQLQTLERDKTRLKGEMDKMMELYLAGQIAKDSFGSYYTPLDLQYRQIENAIPETQAEIDILRIEFLNGDTILTEAQNLYDRWGGIAPEDKRNIVEQITERVTIGGDEIKFKFSYNPAYLGNPANAPRNLRGS